MRERAATDDRQTAPSDELLTVQEAAEFLKATPSTITKWCREGILPSVKLGKVWRISRRGIERMVGAMH
jgi:excisionase family DNA binding protein